MRLFSATNKRDDDLNNLTLQDHFKRFEILGTGQIKAIKKNKTFTKSKIKGINACIR